MVNIAKEKIETRYNNGIYERKCSCCKQWKTKDNYYTRKNDDKWIDCNCKECRKNKVNEYRKNNIETTRERVNKCYNREDCKKRSQKYRDSGRSKEWQHNNKHKLYEYQRDRKQHKQHFITKYEWNCCKQYFNNSCAYCNITENEHRRLFKQDLHKEHAINNGKNNISNCIPSCKSCNSSKGELELELWYSEQSFYNQDNLNKICNWLNNDYKSIKEKQMTLPGNIIAGSKGNRQRVENDFYATPPEATKAILDRVPLSGSILEPACGEGHISKVVSEYYPKNKIFSCDLIDREYGSSNIDFLTYDFIHTFGEINNIITNPPYSLAQEFCERALELATDKVLMFLKIQFLEGQKRKSFFEQHPPKYVYVFSKRMATWNNGSPVDEKGKSWATTVCHCWMVWQKGFEEEPIIRWI